MNTHPHHWRTEDATDNGTHICCKCGLVNRGSDPVGAGCSAPDTDHATAAWLGQAGLYRTRLDAVRNGEQLVEPLSVDQLIDYAQHHMPKRRAEGRRHA